ncbi:hypothetical protein [Runella slithyformis]|uniref:Uncharacterized protein n=1 Tax=Runella slithyformis (strain ATCC 29530 / DSM 19594 / LMG 11500 / NCIMB 11436 / LSU 4) TaxID=761193 RepID=A0A7U3ZLI5_RUNSL|nr:hypothetical protein [Runella slithyformis]AEI49410.1 hypothetical protein Runsl_3025 [Runella slithyformis DSM 19594]
MQPDLRYLSVPIPGWLSVSFAGLVVLLIIGIYYTIRPVAEKQTPFILLGCLLWLSLLFGLAQNAFFLKTQAVPPRFLAAVLPPFLFITGTFLSRKGRKFIDGLSMRRLTWVHTVRIGVELLLFQLFAVGQIPQAMTFEGRNWDILAGLTAPLMAMMVFGPKKWSPRVLLWWNIAALGLLINIVATAVLSAPLPFQQLGFEQPNVGVLKPAFIWLPGFVVPIVLFSHLAAIRRL